MSFRRILKPYRIWVSEKAVAAGFNSEESFPSKAKALAFIKRVRAVDPGFQPLVTTEHHRYEDSVSGKRYRSKFEYERDQQEHQEFIRKEEERCQAKAIADEAQMEEFWRSYEPVFEAHEKKMADLNALMLRKPNS